MQLFSVALRAEVIGWESLDDVKLKKDWNGNSEQGYTRRI